MSAAIISYRICHYCQHRISEEEARKYGLVMHGHSQTSCISCRAVLETARYALMNNLTHASMNGGLGQVRCQGGCNRTVDQIFWEDHTDSMFVDWKDKEKAIMCGRCQDRYARQATDLYRDTAFKAKTDNLGGATGFFRRLAARMGGRR